ncbi:MULTISPECIES: YdbH domain-containing protein [unclassified Pseudoalteromonas]|uniref:intermembrane phospholipid transport protein YdbH family protein n=1 Tax=unclassified Pseudoalteromonas TaxID=194690 RepID=UPI0020973CE4|nr:YdbH domain-containing protein [Pseudoalteromonas sp. XMcav2-N]MCO7188188.1 YdbH domain-containing protein [Pseudoalteromonas sp. XMcav2-N]
MRRFFLILLFALFTIGITVYYFRVPLTLTIGKQILTEEQGLLECLDWSVDSWDRLAVERLCWRSEAVSVEVSNATFDGDHFQVASMMVTHQHTQTDNATEVAHSSAPLELDLPEGMPSIEVEALTVSSPLLPEPLNLSVMQKGDFAFVISGDVEADITLSDTQLRTALKLSSPVIQTFLQQTELPVTVSELAGTIESTFDGQAVNVDIQLDSLLAYPLAQCQPVIQGNGVISGQWDLSSSIGKLDLSQLPVGVNALGCESMFAQLPETWLDTLWSGQWQAQMAEPVTFNTQMVSLPKLSVYGANEATSATFSELEYQIAGQQIQGKLRVSHQSEVLNLLDVQADFLLADMQLESTGVATIEVSQAPAGLSFDWQELALQGQFSLAGDMTELLTFNTILQPQANSVSLQEIRLDNLSGTLSTSTVLAMTEDNKLAEHALFEQVKWELETQAERYQIGSVQGRSLALSGQGDVNGQLETTIKADIQVGSFKRDEIRGKDLSQHLAFTGQWQPEGPKGELTGHSTIELLAHPQLVLRDIALQSEGNVAGSEQLTLDHRLTLDNLELQLTHCLEAGLMPFTVTLAEHGLGAMQSLVSQFVPKLNIEQGLINAEISGELTRQIFDFRLNVDDAAFLYEHHYVSELDLPVKGKWHAGELIIESSPLSVTQVRSGPVLTEVRGQLTSDNNLPVLREFSARVFGGQLAAEQILLSTQDQEILVTASGLDLMLISEAGRESGVELHGRVSGRLPVFMRGGQAEIRDGYLSNEIDSMLKVEDNASFNALKSQRPELETVFGVLDELSIETLSCAVNMARDGQLELAVKIAGENKQQKQPVNFNYTHSENIYTLFRALRLSDEITQEVEKALNQ